MGRKKHIAIFASGSGSNAENIYEHVKSNDNIEVSLILTNNKNAFVIERAKKLNIPYIIFNRDDFYNSEVILDILHKKNIDFIVLAGFLWLIPGNLINAYSGKMINIHPALLPKYGGKGMYGDHVHKAVVSNNESETGITIHYVNDKYDDGNIIFQERCKIEKSDSPEDVANKVHMLEYEFFPKVIIELVENL